MSTIPTTPSDNGQLDFFDELALPLERSLPDYAQRLQSKPKHMKQAVAVRSAAVSALQEHGDEVSKTLAELRAAHNLVAEGRALPDHLKGHAIRGLQHIEREVGQQAAEIMERLETISEGCADVGRGSAD